LAVPLLLRQRALAVRARVYFGNSSFFYLADIVLNFQTRKAPEEEVGFERNFPENDSRFGSGFNCSADFFCMVGKVIAAVWLTENSSNNSLNHENCVN